MNKAFLFWLSTAIAAGISTDLATRGLIAKAGKAETGSAMIQKTYPSATPAITEIWNRVSGAACAEGDAALGMDAGTCAASMAPCSPGTVVSLTCNSDGYTGVSINFAVQGFWTAGEPQ